LLLQTQTFPFLYVPNERERIGFLSKKEITVREQQSKPRRVADGTAVRRSEDQQKQKLK
jgi:hypothetical protein